MLTFRKSLLSLPTHVSRPCTIFVAAGMIATLGGCSEVAGLEEHEAYPGFPDSLSVACSNGDVIVDCETVRTTAPQDGHVLSARPSYEVSGSDVIDHVTGLSWYQIPGDPMSHAKAIDYCEVLPGDYRLPTRIELASLLDFRPDSQVRIDTSVFPKMQPIRYWTAIQYGTDVNEFWGIDFCASCTTQYPVSSIYTSTPSGVLCVKNSGEPFTPGPFVVAGVEDRFLLDRRTGLMWMKKPLNTVKDWVGSLNTCAKAPDGAYGDFRMPNVKELLTIGDEAKVGTSAPAIRDLFDVKNNQVLMSSTPTGMPGKFFALNTTGTSIGIQLMSYTYLQTLCVRGPD